MYVNACRGCLYGLCICMWYVCVDGNAYACYGNGVCVMCLVCVWCVIYSYMCECMESGVGTLGVLLYLTPPYTGNITEPRARRMGSIFHEVRVPAAYSARFTGVHLAMPRFSHGDWGFELSPYAGENSYSRNPTDRDLLKYRRQEN